MAFTKSAKDNSTGPLKNVEIGDFFLKDEQLHQVVGSSVPTGIVNIETGMFTSDSSVRWELEVILVRDVHAEYTRK
jgi:hypothetical protein